jgi:acetolactate synthase-1/2/3 large subunit
VIAVVGTPLDFRLSFGDFGDAQVIHIVDAPSQRAATSRRRLAGRRSARDPLRARRPHRHPGRPHRLGRAAARHRGRGKAAEVVELEADTDPIKPGRIYGELRKVLDRDAVTIGDGGDFVSYAGSTSSRPARHVARPRPVRLPRHRHGLRDGRRVTYPDRQICVLMGDGAAGSR